MKTIVSVIAICFFCMVTFSQDQVYSFDESLISYPLDSIPSEFNNRALIHQNNLIRNENWSNEFTVPGIVGTIYATATDGSNLYIGGNFRIAGGIIANSIVKWDGSKWESLGEGAENGVGGDIPSVQAIAVLNGNVFVGGLFSSAGGIAVNGVAYWDGQKWNRMGTDSLNGVRKIYNFENDTMVFRGFVYSLFAHKDRVIVGGDFDFAGDIRSKAVASWDIETGEWTGLKGGLKSTNPEEGTYAYDFTARGDEIIAGGKFNFAGDVPAKNIARWDGSDWTAIGNAYGYVFDVEFDSAGALLATGYFPAGDSSGSSGVGKWDGNQWTSVSGPKGYNSYVRHIRVYKNGFFAGGSFENDTLIPVVGLAYWEDNNWKLIRGLGQSYNEFLPGGVSGIQFVNGHLYVTGNFTKSGSTYAVNAAEWDLTGSSWKILDDGSGKLGIHDGYIYTLETLGDTLYAGGSFSVAGGTYARNIAKWTGKGWKPVGLGYDNGIRGSVYSLLAAENVLYAGGYFDIAGSTAAFHVARWNGKNWSNIGIGVGGVPGACVNALAKIGNYLYVAGYFAVVGDEENYALPANSIARFDLTTNRWETLGRGIEYVYGIPGRVYALTADGNKLYVGGEFHSADDRNYNNFAVLTDNKWSGIDGYDSIGIEGRVNTIKVFNGEIFIGGVLKPDQQQYSVGILKWEGKKWSTVGDSLANEGRDVFVHDLESFGDGFIAGGNFKYAGDTEVNNIAYFDGSNWNDIGGGVFPGIVEMAISSGKLYIAGPQEIFAGGVPGITIMTYDFDRPVKSEDIPVIRKDLSLITYPNPFRLKTSIVYSVTLPGKVRLSILDSHGKEIDLLLEGYRNTGTYEVEFENGRLSAGVYFCRIIQGSQVVTNKMVIIK